MQVNPALRPLSAGDISQVQEIEREAFPTLWPPTPFRRELNSHTSLYLVAWAPKPDADVSIEPPGRNGRQRDTGVVPIVWRIVSGVKGLLVPPQRPETEDLIVGYVGLWFTLDEAHITSIAVRERWRGLGIGELLLIGAVELAMAHQSRVLSLEVRASNQVAQSLYDKYGFKNVGRRKGYYNDNHEDAFIMTTDPIDAAPFLEQFEKNKKTYRQRRGAVVVILPEMAHGAG